MSQPAHKPKPLNVHIGKYGGVRVDPKEFFADPEVREQIELMRKTDLVGKKLDFKKHPSEKSE